MGARGPRSKPTLVSAGGAMLALLLSLAHAKEQKHADPARSCTSSECHVDVIKFAKLHGPVGNGKCLPCHEVKDAANHKFRLRELGKALCSECHTGSMDFKFVHEPVKKGVCLSCHDPHGSNGTSMLRRAKVADICMDCHKMRMTKKFVHGKEEGKCTGCHSPHGSNNPKLLRFTAAKGCIDCHEALKPLLTAKKDQMHLVGPKECQSCHFVHESDLPHLLREEVPTLCFQCHQTIEAAAKLSDFPHKAVTKKEQCLNCHNPHFTKTRRLLKDQEDVLCFNCHEALKKEITTASFKHGPVNQGRCSPCHAVHGGSYGKLLKNQLGAGLYLPYSAEAYSFCLDCHKKEMLEEPTTDTATRFRNGKRNLHFVHVNDPVKGRTCRACHAVHSGENPARIRTSFPFGKWNVPIVYARTETGGSCSTGCHKTRAYDRLNPVIQDSDKPPPVEPSPTP